MDLSRRRSLQLCYVVYGGLWVSALVGMFAHERWALVGLGGVGLALAAHRPLSRRSEGLAWVVRDRMQGFRKLLGKRRLSEPLSDDDQDLMAEAREAAYFGLGATAILLFVCQSVAVQVLEVQQSMQGYGLVIVALMGFVWSLPTLTINMLIRNPPEHSAEED